MSFRKEQVFDNLTDVVKDMYDRIVTSNAWVQEAAFPIIV